MTNAARKIETPIEDPAPQFQVLPPPADTNGAAPNAKRGNAGLPLPDGRGEVGFGRSTAPSIAPTFGSDKQPEIHVGIAGLPPGDSPPKSNGSQSQAPHKKIRNGKIARLPYTERDMVNRMLRDHIPYAKIVDALDEHGIYVTERNVSNWKTRGGYKQWAAEQDRALTNRLTQDNLVEHLRKNDASALPEVGLQIASTNLSQFFLDPETQQALAKNPNHCHQTITDLCRLARHILSLQKYRDDNAKEIGFKFHPERARREEERCTEITRSVYSAAKLGQTIHEEDTPRRNFIPKEPPPAFPDPLF